MYVKQRYIIRKQFIQMTGYYDRFGNKCTLVTECHQKFIVDQSPLAILDDSIRSIGYDLRGARETAKRLLGNVHHCPILVNPIDRIVVFPTKSAYHEECVWFNPFHIKQTRSRKYKTIITFSNGETTLFPAKVSSFNDKIQKAEQLEEMTRNPFFFTMNEYEERIRIKMRHFYVNPFIDSQNG